MVAVTIFSPIINNVDENGVSIGDYFLSDKTFVHVKDYDGKKKVIGVVGYINKDGEAIITAIEQKRLEWSKDFELVDNLKTLDTYEKAYEDMKGREYTKTVIESKQYSDSRYPAFAYVKNFKTEGTNKGDWYLSAPGELNESVAKNMLFINIALILLNDPKNVKLIELDHYWASAECSQDGAWRCYTGSADVGYDYYKWSSIYVRPSLAFKINAD